MNAGVSTTPCGVVNQPRRAEPCSCDVRNEKSAIGQKIVASHSRYHARRTSCRVSVVVATDLKPVDASPVKILDTERLTLRRMSLDDAPFILALVSDADFIRFIGDKGVRSLEDARGYITHGALASYDTHGFGLFVVELRETTTPIGICGFVKRDTLPDCDIGYAFLPPYRGQGYVVESASAVLAYGSGVLNMTRVLAITDPENERSIRVLEKIGLRFDRLVQLSGETTPVRLYTSDPADHRDAGHVSSPP